jgi:hypothetical protein
MGMKSLGRGLDDISDVFLSESEEETRENFKGLQQLKIRDDKCSSCIHLISPTQGDPKCRVFTFEYEKYGVSPKEEISLTDGEYCKYFEPNPIREAKKLVNDESNDSDLAEIECKVDKLMRINKKLSYPDNENTQKNIRKVLFNHLENGYEIRSINMRKNEEILANRRRESNNITISIIVE